MIKPATTYQEAADILNRTKFNKELSNYILDNLNLGFMKRIAEIEQDVTKRITECIEITVREISETPEKELSVVLLVVNFAPWWSLNPPRGYNFSFGNLTTAIIKKQPTYLDFVLFEQEHDTTLKRTIVL